MTVLDRTAQAIDAVAITPSDTLNVQDANARQRITDGISVGVTGDLRVALAGVSDIGGSTVTIAGIGAGVIHPIRATKIFATGTTATGITAFFT